SWSNRCIPDLQLIFLIEGNYEYSEEGRAPVNLMAGEVLLIEPGRWHTFRSVDRNGIGWISGLHFEFTALGAWAAGDYRLAVAPERVTRVVDVTYLHERFKRLAQVYRSYQPYRELQTSAIAREIVLILVGHWRQPSGPDLSPRMQEMINFIRANLREPLNRQALAKAFRLSPEHINLLFRQELGMTPSSVINRERVMVAYRLIHEKAHSVKEAAYEVGYSDPFYFSRVFKMIFGIPPSHIV
ncbi:MAG: AraC family transcriptional regulator, partial [Chloroflexi bacterium]|nr:AraC family transcriptional regulator [Chloroflexota bacterium]